MCISQKPAQQDNLNNLNNGEIKMAINTFTASGNIGGNCKVAYTQNGKAIATFSLPVKQGYGEHEKVSWVTCKLFGQRAEGQLPSYLTKGTKVTVTGEFVLEQWQGQNGEQNKMPVIIVNQLDFTGSANNGVDNQNQQNMANNGASGSQMSNNQPQQANQNNQQFQTPQQPQNQDDFGDQDIPF